MHDMARKVFRGMKLFLECLLFIVIAFCTWQCNLVMYGVSQAKGQFKIVYGSKPIQKEIENKSLDEATVAKLQLILSVKKFAADSLGLKDNGNYETFYNHGRQPILKVLTACSPFELKPYEWKFPLLGNVSYKGFFNFENGEKEEEILKAKGYDTDFSPTSAWSTLGWFKDPVLSGMLTRNDGQLAELIIHEMTHTTVYLKSSVDFNENLASAVGEMGAVEFLKSTFNDTANIVRLYTERNEDYKRYSDHILRGKNLLKDLYHEWQKTITDSLEMKSQKQKMIENIMLSVDTLSLNNKNRFVKRTGDDLPNNCYFMSFSRYDEQKDSIKLVIANQFNGDVRAYVQHLIKNN